MIVIGVPPKAFNCAKVTLVPPTVMLAKPAGAVTVKLFAVAVAVSATVMSPAEPALLSGIVTVGPPSVLPLIVMTKVAVVVLPSPSVKVYVKLSVKL